MARTKSKPELPKTVRFLTQRQGRTFTVNLLVTLGLTSCGKTERAAMKLAAGRLRDELERLIADAMARPEREPDSP